MIFVYRLYDENRDVNVTLGLRDHFNRPHVIQKTGLLDGLIRGLATQSSQKLDTDYALVVSHSCVETFKSSSFFIFKRRLQRICSITANMVMMV